MHLTWRYVTVSHVLGEISTPYPNINRCAIMEQNSEEFTERVRLLANSILERFNEEQITPQEAGLVILALAHRLMTVLEKNPAERQNFVLQFISLVNRYLAGDLEEGD
ncbi:MAG: hypothetical protein P8X65_05070 [Syntrophobacterales bacterium]